MICVFCGSLKISQHSSSFSQNMVSYAAAATNNTTPEVTKQPFSETVQEQTENIKDNIQQKTEVYSGDLEQRKSDAENTYFYVHSALKSIFPLVFIGCIVLGILIIVFARKNKGLRQRVFLKFCICIPFIFLLLVYSMPYYTIVTQLPFSYINGNSGVKIVITQDTSSPPETISRYRNVLERIKASKKSKQTTAEAYQVWKGYSHLNILLKEHLFVIILACEISGICVIFLCRKKISTKKWAKINLCIVLPCLVLAVVYLIPAIQKVFSF